MELAAHRLLERLHAYHVTRDVPRIAVTNDMMGYEIFARGVYEGDHLDLFIKRLLGSRKARFASSIALDVGANFGNHSLYFSRHFRKVISFEPNPVVANILASNIRLNRISNIDIVQLGLSDADFEAALTEGEDNNMGSFGVGSGQSAKREAGPDGFVVPLRRGDEVVREHASPSEIALVKIDVEGHEPWVLRGLRQTLTAGNPAVLFESKKLDGEDGGRNVVEILRSCGYRHFYSADVLVPSVCRLPWPLGTVGGYVARTLSGVQYKIYELEEIEDRYYSMVVATKERIDLAGVR